MAVATIPETVVGKAGRTEFRYTAPFIELYENMIQYKSEYMRTKQAKDNGIV
jgi:Cu(I)/Ag(I) efflux system membrane protein CusA/SilA